MLSDKHVTGQQNMGDRSRRHRKRQARLPDSRNVYWQGKRLRDSMSTILDSSSSKTETFSPFSPAIKKYLYYVRRVRFL